MTYLAATLYVLGALGTVPTIRATLRDSAVRVYFPRPVLALAAVVCLIAWPPLTLASAVRQLARRRENRSQS